LISYLNSGIEGLNYSLCCMVDYLGFRVICMSWLPVDKTTIRYGTSDGCETVHNKDERLTQYMQQTAKVLNLAPHLVGKPGTTLYSAADIEGHLGFDNNYYLLDFSRAMPPVPPLGEPNGFSHLYKLLRPELVKQSPKPMCPDTFSLFMSNSPTFVNDITQLCVDKCDVLLPKFVDYLEKFSPDDKDFDLIYEMHHHGFNRFRLPL